MEQEKINPIGNEIEINQLKRQIDLFKKQQLKYRNLVNCHIMDKNNLQDKIDKLIDENLNLVNEINKLRIFLNDKEKAFENLLMSEKYSDKMYTDLPKKIKNSVAASDAFFPFPDGIEELAEAGVEAIIQPGGSINDKKVIEAANNAGLVMAFTGIRHFMH